MSRKETFQPILIQKHQPTRREFLTKTSIFAGGLLACGLPFLTSRTSPASAMQQHGGAYSGSRYFLELDGNLAGPLISMESGFVSGQVATQMLGPGPVIKKHLATLLHEEIVFQFGLGMSPALYNWISISISGGLSPKNGAIITTDVNQQIINRVEFRDALITEVAFPALDASSHEPGYLTVKIKPEQSVYQGSSGGQIPPPPPTSQHAWLASNFRLEIGDLPSSLTQQIEPLVIKRNLVSGQTGSRQRGGPVAQPWEIPNLVITLPESQVGPFFQWYQDFVIEGRNSDTDERQGQLTLLNPHLQEELGTINFGNLGIFRLAPVPQTIANSSPLVKVAMYCETMQLTDFPGGGIGASQQSAPRSRRKVPRKPAPGKPLPRFK